MSILGVMVPPVRQEYTTLTRLCPFIYARLYITQTGTTPLLRGKLFMGSQRLKTPSQGSIVQLSFGQPLGSGVEFQKRGPNGQDCRCRRAKRGETSASALCRGGPMWPPTSEGKGQATPIVSPRRGAPMGRPHSGGWPPIHPTKLTNHCRGHPMW